MPAKIVPAAMPLVTVDESPAISNAMANTLAALPPSNGASSDCACDKSLTACPALNTVAAASNIIALFMAQPTSMENNVSNSS